MTVAPDATRARKTVKRRRGSPTRWTTFDREVVQPLYDVIDATAPVRAWVANCGDTDFAHTVALGLLCGAARRHHRGTVRVIASDADPTCIVRARAVTLTAGGLRTFPKAWRDHAMRTLGSVSAVSDWVRRHMVFSTHRLGLDPPFTQLDLVVSREGAAVAPPLARRIADHVAFSLREGGALWLLGGTLTLDAAEFETAGQGGRLFRRVRRQMSRADIDALITDIVAAERFRMGEDLHDGVGQHMTALSLLLHRLRGVAQPTPELLPILERMEETMVTARNDLRAIARGGLQVAITGTSLPDALREAVADARRVLLAEIAIDIKGEFGGFGAESTTQLVRIAQEAIRNAAASGAAHVYVTLRRRKPGIELEIRDDGAGMANDSPYRSMGLGLQIMRHRAGVIGASLRFASGKHGTTILCTL